MLDEEMDHIIREAADKHHPAYNDKAWEQMEKKLDKHLPQKKDRRRLIFFLLFSLLLGGGILFTVSKLGGSDMDNTAGKGTVNGNAADANKDKQLTADNSAAGTTADNRQANTDVPPTGTAVATAGGMNNNNTTPDKTTATGSLYTPQQKNRVPGENEYLYNRTPAGRSNKGKTSARISNPNLSEDGETAATATDGQKKRSTTNTKAKQSVSIANATAEEDNNSAGSNADMAKTEKTEPANTDKKPLATEVAETEKEEKKDKEKEPATKTEEKPVAAAGKKKNNNTFGSNFGITASIGPDMSFVKLNNTGKTTLTYGAGLSYDFAKRFTARAGFYVSKKIYQAKPDEYHSPGGNYPNLTGVDANCKVYEIPVSISYNFGQRNKHNWFGNAGLSSFIMKKEDYTYNYKSPAGQTYTYYQELSNKNKHYFAVLTLSAGYKYQLTNRFSMQAEPYAKIPLGGVGQGKIKLSSAGVLFTVTYKPFKKKK